MSDMPEAAGATIAQFFPEAGQPMVVERAHNDTVRGNFLTVLWHDGIHAVKLSQGDGWEVTVPWHEVTGMYRIDPDVIPKAPES